ncbi:MAG: hypothetical protein HQL52_10525 [Magnetococcales bacterium]|nr:hypothetical protein [Magnetococcales bacterium]
MAKNSALLLISLLFGLVVLEVGLRLFTPFPIHGEMANRARHTVLGYTLNPELPGVDRQGFRNPRVPSSYEIAAIGDSHTYGVNVASRESWPALLSRLSGQSVYNLGVSGYNVLQYHYLVQKALSDGAKTILIGLYPANDLIDTCHLLAKPHYQKLSQRLRLLGPDHCQSSSPDSKSQKKPADSAAKSPTAKSGWSKSIEAFAPGRMVKVITGSATVSALDYWIWTPLQERFSGMDDEQRPRVYAFPSAAGSIDVAEKRVRRHFQYTDLTQTRIWHNHLDSLVLLQDIQEMIARWGGKLLVMIIPSREQVVHHWALAQGLDIPPEYARHIASQVDLVSRYLTFFAENNIPAKSALPSVSTALDRVVGEGGRFYPAGNDGHPFQAGYRAYAEVAWDLLREESP